MSKNIWNLFEQGGFFMWPLLVLSVISMALIIERMIFYFIHRYHFDASIKSARELFFDKKNQPTRVDLGEFSAEKNPILAVASVFRDNTQGDRVHLDNITERCANRVVNRYERGLPTLNLIAAIAPLIGLLGTVWGMVQAFASIAELTSAVKPADLASGIWVALLTTVAGLVVAIPVMISAKIFEGRADKIVYDFNQLVSHLNEWYAEKNDNPEKYTA